MDDVGDTAAPSYYGWLAEIAPVIGAVAAVIVACVYGPPLHAWITLLVMTLLTGFGVTLGFHRLFAHRSFATFRPWVAAPRSSGSQPTARTIATAIVMAIHTRPTSGPGTGSGCYGESGMRTSSGCTRTDTPTNCRRLGI
jgi:hypothetical protein